MTRQSDDAAAREQMLLAALLTGVMGGRDANFSHLPTTDPAEIAARLLATGRVHVDTDRCRTTARHLTDALDAVRVLTDEVAALYEAGEYTDDTPTSGGPMPTLDYKLAISPETRRLAALDAAARVWTGLGADFTNPAINTLDTAETFEEWLAQSGAPAGGLEVQLEAVDERDLAVADAEQLRAQRDQARATAEQLRAELEDAVSQARANHAAATRTIERRGQMLADLRAQLDRAARGVQGPECHECETSGRNCLAHRTMPLDACTHAPGCEAPEHDTGCPDGPAWPFGLGAVVEASYIGEPHTWHTWVLVSEEDQFCAWHKANNLNDGIWAPRDNLKITRVLSCGIKVDR